MRKIFIVIALMMMLLPLVADVMPEFKHGMDMKTVP